MERIKDVAEEARDKSEEALKVAQNAPRMSQVEAVMDAKLESLFNKHGQIDPDRLPREVILSNQKRYRLMKQVGKRGIQGTVFEAKLISFSPTFSVCEKVALKICESDSSGRAEREAEILQRLSAQLNHDNIVKFIDSALDGQHLVIIMQLIKGQSLDDWLEQRYSNSTGVTFSDTQPIVKQLVQGMAAIHALDIAHRDLKPGNLVFDEVTGMLVIVDFGLSKQHNSNSTVTSANTVIGTPLYMSPEQLDGDVKGTSFPADIWAIGIIWHEMLTNLTPFEPAASKVQATSSASSKQKTFSRGEEAQMYTEAKKPDRQLPMLEKNDVPKPVIDIIAKCLSADKKDRYQNAQELFVQIDNVFLELERGPATQGSDSVKPFKSWSVKEVCNLIRSIGSAFVDKANAMEENGIDGQFFLDMIKNDDEDLRSSIPDGGLGFTNLQLKRVKDKIKEQI